MAENFEVIALLAEETDIDKDIEVEEKEVKSYDYDEETEFTSEDFRKLNTLDYVDQNVMSVLEEHRLDIPQLTFVDKTKISKVKEIVKEN